MPRQAMVNVHWMHGCQKPVSQHSFLVSDTTYRLTVVPATILCRPVSPISAVCNWYQFEGVRHSGFLFTLV